MAKINFESLIEAGVSADDAYDYIANHGKVHRMLWTELDDEERRWAEEDDVDEPDYAW